MSTGPGELRIGQGIDVHHFSDDDGRPLVLGGVVITGDGAQGLEGHSDADAVAHAVSDAVLGAAGLGDLGRHAPDTDPQWKGADSMTLLARVVELAREGGWSPVNADCTLVAERPRLSPFVDRMAQRLAAVLGAPVNVKATRAEGLGALGRAEGIACTAVVLLSSVDRGDDRSGDSSGDAR
ncbi:MAG: 2-C-methyl-D-erythritol 2,4-cyclodiphosphate synthase [Acidimicrobiales bacterium]